MYVVLEDREGPQLFPDKSPVSRTSQSMGPQVSKSISSGKIAMGPLLHGTQS